MRNVSTIVRKQEFSTSGTCNKFKTGRLMFGFQYKHQYFYQGDGEQWIMWDEMHSPLKGGELGAQIICLWEL
jgi:hypothetical protein